MERVASNKTRRWLLKIALALGSTIVTVVVVLLTLKVYASTLGIRDPEFRYENQIGMWRSDPELGFRNKANFDAYCFGTVHVTTNDDGFRGSSNVAREKPKGKTRIFGLGDSVMWGTSVNQEDSFLGLLQTKLDSQSRDFEVINAGVVGYSTIQEMLFLDQTLVDFAPDIVLVNFCENDLMPSEDPFFLIRDVYARYLLGIVDDPATGLSVREKEIAREFVQTFIPVNRPRNSSASTIDEKLRIMTKLCLLVPVRQMIRIANERDFRLIFIFIPSRDPSSQYTSLSRQLMALCDEQNVEYLDMESLMHSDPARDSLLTEQTNLGFWDWVQITVLPDLRNIRVVRRFEQMHQSQNYIDFVHPSRKGNEIIAERIFQHLMTPAD